MRNSHFNSTVYDFGIPSRLQFINFGKSWGGVCQLSDGETFVTSLPSEETSTGYIAHFFVDFTEAVIYPIFTEQIPFKE